MKESYRFSEVPRKYTYKEVTEGIGGRRLTAALDPRELPAQGHAPPKFFSSRLIHRCSAASLVVRAFPGLQFRGELLRPRGFEVSA